MIKVWLTDTDDKIPALSYSVIALLCGRATTDG